MLFRSQIVLDVRVHPGEGVLDVEDAGRRSLLEERFKLRWHRETREGPVYVLSVARGGHRLRPSKDCVVERDPAKPLPAPPPGRTQPLCGNNWLNGRGPMTV